MSTEEAKSKYVVLIPFLQHKKKAVVEMTSRQSVFLEMGGFIKLKTETKSKSVVKESESN